MVQKIQILLKQEDWEGDWFDVSGFMYWFEENGVDDIRDLESKHIKIRIIVDGVEVYKNY